MKIKQQLAWMLLGAAVVAPGASAYEITLDGATHEIDELISRQVGPGITYKRLRSETFPLNINMLIMDVTNPYNRIQTTTANESAMGTELLVNAAARQSNDQMKAIAGANGNFWCVSSQYPYAPTLVGSCFAGHAKNGQMITETNDHLDIWAYGWSHSGMIACDVDKKIHCNHLRYEGILTSPSGASANIHEINKVVRPTEIGMYNSFFGRSKSFLPVEQVINNAGNWDFEVQEGVSTELILDFVEGQEWKISEPMSFKVAEIRLNAGTGTLGDHDCALVLCGDYKTMFADLQVGDIVTVETNYSYADNTKVKIDNFITGLALVMENGEYTTANDTDDYNSQTYSRTGYGCSEDGNTLYVIVIDKASDPTWGSSFGCNTKVMCDIARHYGCVNLAGMDAGGSAEMFLHDAIINKTTEGSPRPVSNGWLLYSTAPQDDQEVAQLAFYDLTLQAPSYSSFTPQVIAYNQYGDIIDYDFKDFTLSCAPELGTCEGSTFIAGPSNMTGELTASCGSVSVSKEITVFNAPVSIRIHNIVLDGTRTYTMEVTSTVDGTTFEFDPTTITWTIDDPEIATLDSNGLLTGLRNGVTTIHATLGEYTDEATVNVEIPEAQYMAVTDYADWTLKGSSAKDLSMDDNGLISLTLSSTARAGGSVTMTKEAKLYSLPEHLWLEFEASCPVSTVTADVRTPLSTRTNAVDLTNDGNDFAANTPYRVEFPLDGFGDMDDLISFPLTLNSLKFTFPKSTDYNGAQTITFKALETEYSHFSGIESVVAGSEANGPVEYYNLQGIRIANPAPGTIVIRRQGSKATKIRY
ncbi:MAG: phosphodiester glycosidase family protein [Bacteroidales bacterium]|nr:phosphodiester glycosidase family protein [Bacteroidales bacterium]